MKIYVLNSKNLFVPLQEKKVDAQKEEEKKVDVVYNDNFSEEVRSLTFAALNKVTEGIHYINSNGISNVIPWNCISISNGSVFGEMDFKSTELDEINPMEARFVTRKHKNKTKTVFIEPKIYDINYPVKGYFNLEKSTIVLVFDDGSKVKTISESASKSKAYTGVLISLAKRILGPQSETDRNSVGAIYNKFGSDAQAEAVFYGVVLSYFVSNGLVKDPATFDMWLVEFLTKYLVQMTDKKE